MNKKLISITLSSLGLCVGFSQFANAQSNVTLYGVMDAGLRYSTNAGIDLAQNSHQGRLSANSSGKDGSRFGFRGTEDLGGGQKIIFNLESGFNVGTGALNSKNDNKTFSNNSGETSLFGRQAYVGFEDSKFGKITLGRQFTVGFDTARIFDPSNVINQSGLIYDLSGTADGINNNRRSDSTVKYTYTKDGLTLRTSIKPGNHAGSFTNGNAYALGASYKFGTTEIASSFTRISHHRHKEDFSKQITSNGYSNIFNIGFAHKMGGTTLKGGYSNSQIPAIDTSALQQNSSNYKFPLKMNGYQSHNLGFGFDHQVTPRLNVNAATYSQYRGTARHGDLIGFKYLLGSTYKLSPRTSLYGYVDQTLHTFNLSAHNSRKTRTGVTLGISHRF